MNVRRTHLTPRRAGLLTVPVAALTLALGAPAGAGAAPQASYRTQALPSPDHVIRTASARGGRSEVTSRFTIRAGKRFSLAAVRWPGTRAIQGRLRARQTSGKWSRWTEFESEQPRLDGAVEAGGAGAARIKRRAIRSKKARESTTEPIWTGPSRVLQLEVTGRVPRGLYAAFVDVKGASAASARTSRTRTSARRVADGYAGIQPRASWDPGNECKPRTSTPALGTVEGVVVHHTAGSNNYTQAQVPALLLGICKYHRNGNGWNDVGYNVLVDRYGGAWEGRAGGLTNPVIGAHAQGFNSNTSGVSILGDFTSVAPPGAALDTVARVAAWRLAVAGVPATGTATLRSAGGSASRFKTNVSTTQPRIMGHRDVGLTACPGNVGYPLLDGVRAAAATLQPALPAGLPSTGVSPVVNPVKVGLITSRRVRGGSTTQVRGTVKQGSSPVRGASLALQVRTGSEEWMEVAKTTTNAQGRYRFKHRFSRTWELRVARTDAAADPSRVVNVVMVANLSLKVAKRFRAKRPLRLTGRITPGRGPVILQMERRSPSGRWVKSDEEEVEQKGRTLRVTVTPPSATLYRFRFVYRGSDLTAKARSPLVYARGV